MTKYIRIVDKHTRKLHNRLSVVNHIDGDRYLAEYILPLHYGGGVLDTCRGFWVGEEFTKELIKIPCT